MPLTLEASVPEPDIVVARGRSLDYFNVPVTAEDVGLIIEVAKTSLKFDRGPKATIYAEVGIPEYWIVDTAGQTVEVCRQPKRAKADQSADYSSRKLHKGDNRLTISLDQKTIGEIVVADLFPA